MLPVSSPRVANPTTRRRAAVLAVVLALGVASLGARPDASGQEAADLAAVQRIKAEAFERSQVMDVLHALTDVHGPILTGSPAMRAAGDYLERTLSSWGLANVHRESYPFGRGWTNDRLSVHLTAPQAAPLIAQVRPWTPGTPGTVTARAVLAPMRSDEDFARWRGQLAGRFVLTEPACALTLVTEPASERLTPDKLADLSRDRVPAPRPAMSSPPRNPAAGPSFHARKMAFLLREGIAALVDPGCMGSGGGTIFVGGGGSWRPDAPPVPAQVVLAAEHYNRLRRLLERDVAVTLEVRIDNRFFDEEEAFNVIAEIPGGDRATEVVMLGAHFDSVHMGTGATDNAAGTAVVMEAMRILAACGVRPRRTIRLALWSGEEQVYLGSEAYVHRHFVDAATGRPTPAHARVSAYFNVDNGAGAIRGIHTQGNDQVVPIFAAWLEPFRSLGATTISPRSAGGTDHVTFDAAGIPAFQFIQDWLEYVTRTHHSNMDVYDRVPAADLVQNAAIVASLAYHAAMRDALLPRKPLPATLTRPSASTSTPAGARP